MGDQRQARRLSAAGSAMGWVVLAFLVVVGSAVAIVNPEAHPVPFVGSPFYPDLVALAPDDLYLTTEVLDDGLPHFLLRFSTSVVNIGDGRLELEGSTEPASTGDVSQIVYDAAFGGTVVEERNLGIDFVHHASHHHFHLANFATYELLREDSDGTVPTGQGGKQSSCVLDTTRSSTTGPTEKQYDHCELARQGLSVGWMDTYAASLPDQWVDLGFEPLADGVYVLRYTVDPSRQLAEAGRVGNNMADTRFTVRDGGIVGRPEPPRCAIDGDTIGSPGQTVTLRCSHFNENSWVGIYWDAWDPWDAGGNVIASFTGNGADATTVDFPLPNVTSGAYTITAVSFDRASGRHVSATVIHGVEPESEATPAGDHERASQVG